MITGCKFSSDAGKGQVQHQNLQIFCFIFIVNQSQDVAIENLMIEIELDRGTHRSIAVSLTLSSMSKVTIIPKLKVEYLPRSLIFHDGPCLVKVMPMRVCCMKDVFHG